MSSFRSRQRNNQRRDLTSRERSANSPAGGNQSPPAASGKPPRADKRQDGSQPRAPYSGQRPGPGKPDWKQTPRQGERSFDQRGPAARAPQEGGFQDKRYDRDRGPSGRKPMPADDARAPAFRREDQPQDKRYSRDRGPSGRKPLHTEDAPPRQFKPRAEGEPRRDDKPQWQNREQRAPREDQPARKPLFGKPSADRDAVERDNRFRRENHHDERPRQHPSQGLQPFGDSHRVDSPERRQQFEQRRHDKPQWQASGSKPEITLTGRLDSKLALFAPCPRGLEALLADELKALGADDIAPADGGVAFGGDARLMMAVNLHSRTASRVLLRLAHGPYHAEQDIYRLALSVDWPRWFDVSRTIKLKADGIAARVKSLDYIALTVKDAICDRFRQAQLGRPNVDTRAPDVRVNVFLTADTATVYLDTSGEPLFKRGWREEAGEAPLRENLAAGILMLAGYDGSQPLIDPMCGSGTFLVEAADIALNRAPGRNRRFGFEALASFDQVGWETLRLAASQAEKAPAALDIRGSDRDKKMIAIARANLQRAGLAGLVEAMPADILDVRPGAQAGLIVSNPPYGIRLDELDQLAAWYPLLGDWLKAHFSGWTACLFSGDLRLGKLIRLSPKRRTPLYNGSLACRLFVINMVEGSARKQKDGGEAADDDAAEE